MLARCGGSSRAAFFWREGGRFPFFAATSARSLEARAALSRFDLNELELGEWVRRARSLRERLAGPGSSREAPEAADSVSASVSEQLRRWTWAFSHGDRDSFRARLSWDDLSEDSVLQLLADAEKAPQQGSTPMSLPPWARELVRVLPHFGMLARQLREGDTLPERI